ncbi:MAG: hypothetical protein VZR36_08820 [Prevotella sp.]|nr:hypothetical protein [Prevotella sp.]
MSYFTDKFDASDSNRSAKEIMGELIHAIIWQHNGIVGGEELNAADVVIDDKIGDNLLKMVSKSVINFLTEKFYTHQYILTAIRDGKLIDIFKHDEIEECFAKVAEWSCMAKFVKADLTLYDTDPSSNGIIHGVHVLYNDKLRELSLKKRPYRATMERYDSAGESIEVKYTNVGTIKKGREWLNEHYLNDAPYDGSTCEIERIMDIRPYANYVWGERYELMDGSVTEFRISENQ